MPRGDGKGPDGKGPRTGRGLGKASGNKMGSGIGKGRGRNTSRRRDNPDNAGRKNR